MSDTMFDMMFAASLAGSGEAGFTPTEQQLTAMNSGITSTDVAQITTNKNNILLGNINVKNAHYTVPTSINNSVVFINGSVEPTQDGAISSTTTKRATHIELIEASYVEINFENFEMAVYAYNKANKSYAGRVTTDNTISTSGTILYAKTFDLSSFCNDYYFRVQLKRENLDDIDCSNLSQYFKYTQPNDDYKQIVIDGMYPLIGSPNIYIPTAITGETIDSTTTSDIYTAYDALITNYSDWVSKEYIGKDSNGDDICAYTINYGIPQYSTLSETFDVSSNKWDTTLDNKHILITSGVHGGEKASVVGVKDFASLLLSSSDDWAKFIRNNYVIHIIPIVNTWGFNNNSRRNKDNIDINRDFELFTTPEAKAVKEYIAKYGDRIKVIIDSHNSDERYGYICTNPNFKYHRLYARTAANLAATLSTYLSGVYASSDFPYFFAWQTTYTGTLNVYGNSLGKICTTIETPRNFTSGAVNNSEISPFVIGILANTLPYYGMIG